MKVFLIGMPGCGKTTLGKIAAKKLGMEFADMDKEIEKAEGRSISDIFKLYGEEYFRDAETKALREEAHGGENKIVSTGGGIVVKEENIEILQNSGAEVIFIDRPPECIEADIECSKRPLMKNGADAVYKLYRQRYARYERACTAKIINNSDFGSAVSALIRVIRSRCL